MDAALQELAYKFTLATAPIWVPVLGLYLLFHWLFGGH